MHFDNVRDALTTRHPIGGRMRPFFSIGLPLWLLSDSVWGKRRKESMESKRKRRGDLPGMPSSAKRKITPNNMIAREVIFLKIGS